MKKLLITCLLNLIIGATAIAQSQYELGMEKALALMENNEPKKASDLFERLAEAEKDNWLPYYYASQIKIIESLSMNDMVKKEQQLEEAQELLDQALLFAEEDSVEVMVLQAMLHTSRLTIDPNLYGMNLSPIITRIYTNASEKAPNNPRVMMSKAEWNMGAAKYFGEDPKQYCDEIQASLELYGKEVVQKKYYPSWGEDRAKMLIARNCADRD